MAAVLFACAAALALPTRPRLPRVAPRAAPTPAAVRAGLCLGAGAMAALAFGGGFLVLATVSVASWQLLRAGEGRAARHHRDRVRADLVALVGLVALSLRAGRSVGEALASAVAALPGPAADRASGPVRQLELGSDPGAAWEELSRDPELAALGRALGRAHLSGSSVADVVDQLAEELAATARAEVEDRARQVGVKAAVPLGVCFLPAFLALGIVPLVAGLVGALRLGS